MKRTFLAVAALLATFSCDREGLGSTEKESGATTITLTGIELSTKSTLGDGIDSKISGVKLAAYDEDGSLAATGWFDSGSTSGLTLRLNQDKTHNIYALVNMGDVEVPTEEEEMASLEWYIDSFSQMETDGLPMAGVSETLEKGATECSILVERLMAKLVLSLSGKEVSQDQITAVTLCNWNRRLLPFADGGGAALSSDDVSSGEEGMFDQTDLDGEQIVLYVPENMQGDLLLNNYDETLKTPEGLSAYGYDGMDEQCTYVQLDVWIDPETTENGVSGSLSYRFFLGSDNSSNFDVKRNTLYTLTLVLSWNGQFLEDSWLVSNKSLTDARVLALAMPITEDHTDGSDYTEGTYLELWAGWEAAAFVSFTADGEELDELGSFGEPDGWCISETTLDLIEENGVEYEVTKATAVYDTLNLMLRYVRDGEEIPENCIDTGSGLRCCVMLSMEEHLLLSENFVMTLQTTDGTQTAKAYVTMYPYSWNNFALDRDEEGDPYYIGQCHLLSIDAWPDWAIDPIMWSRVGQGSLDTITELNEPDDTLRYLLRTQDKGSIYIYMGCGYGSDEIQILQPVKSIYVHAPTLSFGTDTMEMGPEEDYDVPLGYYGVNGEKLYVGSGDKISYYSEYEYSNNFYPPDYDSLLAPSVDYEIEDDDGTGTHISFTLESDGWYTIHLSTDSEPHSSNSTPNATITATAPSDDITDAVLEIWVYDY